MISEYYKNKVCVVTGGTGFVGRNIVNELLNFEIKNIIIFDRTLKFDWNDKRIIYIKGDLFHDIDKLNYYNFDIIFHQAADVDTTCIDEEYMLNNNFIPFKNLVKICENKNAKLIYASSAAIYGNSEVPNKVGHGENPLNIYAKSKLLMDNYLRENKHIIKIPVIGIRYFNVFGPGELHKERTMSMISQMIISMKKNNNINLFEFGEHRRDFVYVKDVVMCNILCGIYDKSDIFNCGFGYSESFNNVYNIIKSQLKTESKINYIPLIYNFFQTNTSADISKTNIELGYKPNYNIKNGIIDYIDSI